MVTSNFSTMVKDMTKVTAASITAMLFGIMVLLCLGIGISGLLALRKAKYASRAEQEDLWLGIGWTAVIVGFTPLVLLSLPHVLSGFGQMVGYVLVQMILK